MKPYRIELRNIDGTGKRRCRVYELAPADGPDYWSAVTDVLCPVCEQGRVLWAEAGHVPGYRICDQCHRHFLAIGNAQAPALLRVGNRSGLT